MRYFIGILVICFLMVCSEQTFAQKNKSRKKYYSGKELKGNRKESGSFITRQGWLGLKLGINLTKVVPEKRYSSFSPIQTSEISTYKQYESFNKVGVQAGIELNYSLKFFSITIQPNFRRQIFAYRNEYVWTDENPNNTLQLNYYQQQYLDYIDIPLLLKFEYPTESVRPFILIGGYYGWLVDANKSVEVTGVDRASGSDRYFEKEAISVGAKELYADYSAGLIGGIGLNYDLGNIRLTFDATYRYGMNNISSKSNRYSDSRLAGIGDVADDFKMNNISINVGILFPMKFLSTNYMATE